MANYFLSRRVGSGQDDTSLLLSTTSLLIACLGSSLMAFAPRVWVFVVGFAIATLGSGTTVSLRAFLATTVDRAFSGRLFASIAAISTIGNVVGMPVMGALYSASISQEMIEISLPFVVSAVSPNIFSSYIAHRKLIGMTGILPVCYCGPHLLPSPMSPMNM